MRTRFELKFVCAQCGTTLEIDTDNKHTEITLGNAYEYLNTMAVKPCYKCVEDYKRPASLIKEAISLLEEKKQ